MSVPRLRELARRPGKGCARMSEARDFAATSRILYVAYPLLTVSDESAGGAEQMLLASNARWRPRASDHRGRVRRIECRRDAFCDAEPQPGIRPLSSSASANTSDFLVDISSSTEGFDLVHDHSGAFSDTLPTSCADAGDVASAARLSIGKKCSSDTAPNLSFNCVSQVPGRFFSDLPHIIGAMRTASNWNVFH